MTDADQEQLQRQFADLNEERLDAADAHALNARLAADPNARLLYLQWMDLQMELENVAPSKEEMMPMQFQRPRPVWPMLAAVAAIVLVFFGIRALNQPNKPEPNPIVAVPAEVLTPKLSGGLRVVGQMGAEWAGENRPSMTDGVVPTGRLLQLSRGVVEIREAGVSYTIEGPARFACSERNLQVTAGKVLVSVDDGAGVQVFTPSAKLEDLGTVFGVEVANGIETCHVFEGAVRATAHWQGSDGGEVSNVDIQAGESLSLRAQVGGRFAETDKANWLGFVWRLHHTDGVAALGGKVDVRSAAPADYSRDYPIVLVPEGSRMLDRKLAVDIVAPGRYPGPFEKSTTSIAGGQSVRSYVAHYAPGRHKPPRETRVAVITFDSPVVGIICSPQALKVSDRLFKNVAPNLTGDRLAKTGHLALEHEDGIYLSEDRRQVAIYMEAWFADQIRIITEDSP